MTDRKPPPHGRPRSGSSSIDSTVLLPRPELSDRSVDDGPVFNEGGFEQGADDDDESGRTHTMKAPPRTTASSTADVSVIEARESPSDGAVDGLGDGIRFDEQGFDERGFDEGYAPATEVLRLAFSDPGGDSVTPAEPEPIVRKWRAGNPGAGAAGALPIVTPPEPPREPGIAGTRVDAVPSAGPTPAAALDVEALTKTLEEAEKLLRTVKSQASSLDLDLVAPGARGMNAQLAAALHRLSEALAMLRK